MIVRRRPAVRAGRVLLDALPPLLALAVVGCAHGGARRSGGAAPASSAAAFASDPVVLPLWPAGAPGSTAPGDTGRTLQRPLDERGPIARITDVTRPTMTVYRATPVSGRRPALLVFPGGGYQWLAVDIEGTEVCQWLTRAGLACILVRYRVPQPSDSSRYVQPLQDAQRAVGLVREHAADWNIDPARVGVLGFSAGAHIAAVLTNHFTQRNYAPVDAADRRSCRPDFALVVYPGYMAIAGDSTRVRPEVQPTLRTPPTFIARSRISVIGLSPIVAKIPDTPISTA